MQYKQYGLLISLGILLNLLVGCSTAESLISTISVASEFGERQVYGNVLVLPIGDGEPDHLVVINQQISPSAGDFLENPVDIDRGVPVFISYLQPNGETWEILWEQQVGDISLNQISLFHDGSLIYAVVEDTVWAWEQADGVLQWQLTLQDVVARTCEPCVYVSQDRLLLLTQDRYLYAIDPQAGEISWDVRLNAEHGVDALTVIEDQVMVLDRADDDSSTPAGLSWYQLADGTLARHVAPTCASDGPLTRGLRTNDIPVYNATVDEVLFVIDGGSGDSCLLRLSLVDGTLLQEIRVPRETLPHESPARQSSYVWDEQTLYTNNREGELLAFDMETETSEVLTAVTDTELTLQQLHDGILLVRAQRTRGVEQNGLWGIDQQTGDVLWQQDLQNTKLFGVDTSWTGDWVWRLGDDTVTIIEVIEETDGSSKNYIMATQLNVTDGTELFQTTTRVGDVFWNGLTWTPDYAYLSMRNLYRVDLETGEGDWAWPFSEPFFTVE